MIPEVDSKCLVVGPEGQKVQAAPSIEENTLEISKENSQLIPIKIPKRNHGHVRSEPHRPRAEKRIPAKPLRREWPYREARQRI